MKRLAFLSTLLGGSAAEQGLTKVCEVNEIYVWNDRTKTLDCRKAYKNNECPVCHAIAEPYRRELYNSNGILVNCRPTLNGNLVVCDQPNKTPTEPSERITRCRNCNVAFWQDAEDSR